jgi:coenzyme F420 biosynthesis associated uncharacterized protein
MWVPRMSPSAKSRLTVGRAVDWQFAATVGTKLVRPGPAATEYTRRQIIDQLAEASRKAELPVREVTELSEGGEIPEARIVDRVGWIRAATQSMQVMTGGSPTEDARNGSRPRLITGRITGAQTGAVLAFVSSGILGQYDPFGPNGGELLLVYPNVIGVERQLRVLPADFRLWVCLHEVTHRVQFRANPWLAEHMSQALAVLTQDAGEDLGEVIGRLAELVRNRRDGVAPEPNSSGILGLLRAVQSEPQRRALDQLLVLGTLLEGHADHVMDAVGPAVVPTVTTIRRRFDERRKRKQPPLQRIVRALLGFDAKLSQYTRGKAFVDHVVGRVGMTRFNAIWSNAENLPLPIEIDEPQRWIDRVL